MRDIKLRAWIIGENKMSYSNEWFSMYPFDMIQYADQGFWINNKEDGKEDEFILMQYTGLKDKNGKEMYDDDIVIYNKSELFKIVYSDQKACFSLEGTNVFTDIMAKYHEHSMTSLFSDRFEVIGNIYENPELLKIN